MGNGQSESAVQSFGLIGRHTEMRVLDQMCDAVQSGEGRVLVIRGEPGVGKTALLEYVARRSKDFRVLRASGVQAEMELAFAGLHQLLSAILDRLEQVAKPQREALLTTFGMTASAAPDRFFLALAVLSLLSVVAEQQPLLCVIDDQQWLDSASTQALAFVARRLEAERVGLIFAARVPGDELSGLPELEVVGLAPEDAGVLLDSVLTTPVDPRVRDQIVAETHGNPLALLELPRGVRSAELAGGFNLPSVMPLSSRIEESFRRRLEALPAPSRRLLLLAAADPVGEAGLLWNAAARLGIENEAAASAMEAGLVEIDARVKFRHPLVRSAIYRSASLTQKYESHRALADATDPRADPDRRAWHRAQASPGPDEAVAEELERSADRAQARGGLAAAAAFLARAAELTPEPSARARRMLAAAKGKRDAGALDAALGLLVAVEAGRLDALQRAQVEYLRGEIAFDQLRVRDAARLLRSAATRYEMLDAEVAREVRLQALDATMWLADMEGTGGMRAAAVAARTGPASPQPPRAVDALLDALATLYTDGYEAGAPLLENAVRLVLSPDVDPGDARHWLPLARSKVSAALGSEGWDAEAWHAVAVGLAQFVRLSGAPLYLQFELQYLAWTQVIRGEFSAAALTLDEDRLIAAATGNPPLGFVDMLLASWRGQEQAASEMIDAVYASTSERGVRKVADFALYSRSVLCNGLGRYEAAFLSARHVFDTDHVGFAALVIPELVQAASHIGYTAVVAAAHDYVSKRARVTPTPWALGIEARFRALLACGDEADRSHRESLEHLAHTRVDVELARGYLTYGEWLRRENRRVDARKALRTADEMFSAMGAAGFAQRAQRELLATGETARKRTGETATELTPQESAVARLARDGFSNPEIGTQLFISPRTVQYHLRKVFSKLGIRSRAELPHVLPPEDSQPGPIE